MRWVYSLVTQVHVYEADQSARAVPGKMDRQYMYANRLILRQRVFGSMP
jgi:hypothetical protein